jgi:WD40 repeat protein
MVAYDIQTRKLKEILWDDPQGRLLCAVTFSPDGQRLATGGFNSNVMLFDWPACQLLRTMPVTDDGVLTLAFSPDGLRLVSGGESIQFWNVATGEELASLLPNRLVYDLKFNADGTALAAGCGDGSVQLYTSEGEERVLAPDDP